MKKLVLVVICLIPVSLFAQYSESIRTGRPGQAIGAYTVGKNVFQIQSGLTYNMVDFSSDAEINSFVHSTVLRLGVAEKLEVSGVINWQKDRITTAEQIEKFGGISNTQIGARYNFTKNQGAIPAIGIQGRLLLNAQSQDYRRDKLGSKFIVATGNKINDWLSIGTNFGMTWSGNNQDPKSLYVLNFSFGLTEKIGAFAEMYGSFEDSNPFFDGGISYLIHNDLQLDISAGWDSQRDISSWFVDGGLSYRIDWRQ